jgi:hypothetical protein
MTSVASALGSSGGAGEPASGDGCPGCAPGPRPSRTGSRTNPWHPALVLLYWQVGRRTRTEILKSQRATYGEEIVSTVSRRSSAEFGNGYSRPNLFRTIRFAEVFPDREIVSTLSRQLGWSHFVEIISLEGQRQPNRPRPGRAANGKRVLIVITVLVRIPRPAEESIHACGLPGSREWCSIVKDALKTREPEDTWI